MAWKGGLLCRWTSVLQMGTDYGKRKKNKHLQGKYEGSFCFSSCYALGALGRGLERHAPLEASTVTCLFTCRTNHRPPWRLHFQIKFKKCIYSSLRKKWHFLCPTQSSPLEFLFVPMPASHASPNHVFTKRGLIKGLASTHKSPVEPLGKEIWRLDPTSRSSPLGRGMESPLPKTALQGDSHHDGGTWGAEGAWKFQESAAERSWRSFPQRWVWRRQ